MNNLDAEVVLSLSLGAAIWLFVLWRWTDSYRCRRCRREVPNTGISDGMCWECRLTSQPKGPLP